MSQFGSMDKPPLPSSTRKKKKKLPSSWLIAGANVLSLNAAVLFGCIYVGSAAYNLFDPQHGPPSCPCQCQCQCLLSAYSIPWMGGRGGVPEPEPEPERAWLFVRRYVLTDTALPLLHGLLKCSAAAAGTASLALLVGGGRSLGVRAAACVALAAMAISHWMYLRMLGLFRVNSPGDQLYLALETACVVAAAALNLLGFMAFVLGVGGDGEQAGRAPARAG